MALCTDIDLFCCLAVTAAFCTAGLRIHLPQYILALIKDNIEPFIADLLPTHEPVRSLPPPYATVLLA